MPRRERAARVARALAAVGLAEAADRHVLGRIVRRLELAQALVSASRLLILDEPTVGPDLIALTGVWGHIDAIRAATSMTVLITNHFMDEADQYCDRVG